MNRARLLLLVVLPTVVATLPASLRAEASAPAPQPQQAAVETGTVRQNAPAPAPPPPQPRSGELVLTGFVGPGYDIGLRDASGNEVNGRELPAGTYRIEIYDYSTIHNFELKGDNFDGETDVSWTGHVTWRATFNPGEEYEYECDPHHHLLYGEFRIGTASGPPPPPPTPPPGPPPPAGGTLYGTVRGNATIALRHADGTQVTQVSPGTWTIQVTDETASHNFHLSGPGVDRSTEVSGSGTVTWTVALSTGTYGFQCDPHRDFMRGSFTVGSGPVPPPPPQPPPPPPPGPPATPGLLIATVRSNYTIDVRTPAGQKVDTVKPGPYTIEVRDQSNEHNFRLQGPNVGKSSTVGFVGTQKWAITLSPGTYRYQCDPHATVMKGVLTVTKAAAGKTKVSAFRVRRSGRRAIVNVKVDRAVSARIQLLRRSRVVSGFSGKLRRGSNVKRLRGTRPGRYLVRLVLIEHGTKRTYARSVRL